MKDTLKTNVIARRDLLKIAPLAGLAVCAPDASEADVQERSEPADDPRQVRLADTEYARKYYKLARG